VHVFENFDFPDYFGQENKDSNFHNFLHGDVNNLEKLYFSTVNNTARQSTLPNLWSFVELFAERQNFRRAVVRQK